MTGVPQPRGWNTWDVRTHTGMTHVPSGARVRFGLLGPDGPVVNGFTWRHGLVRLGHHDVNGAYAEVTVEVGGTPVHIVLCGGPGDVLNGQVRAAGAVVVDAQLPPGWRVDLSAPVRWADSLLIVDSGEVDLRIAPADVPGSAVDVSSDVRAVARAVVRDRRSATEGRRLRSGGWLGTAADALTRAVTWNTIHAPGLGRVLTPTSRDFVSGERAGFYRSWALHAWDTFFTGLVASAVDRDYARGIFTQILPFADASGMIPNRVSDDRGTTLDRSQPPVGALTIYRAYLAGGLSEATRDRSLLEATFPALLAWHDWWPAARTGPHGLLAWGSDPVPGDPESATLDRAKRESGLDDSPMYDDARYDPSTRTMDLADVGLNALHIADADALAAMATRLGEHRQARRLRAEAARARRHADGLLWDSRSGGYRNLRSDGRSDRHVSPTLLYPLLARLPDAERARAIADDLLRPDVLGGPRPIPSVARNDPGFAATYWRGRIWAPMAYLAVEGLRRYGLDDLARPVVDDLLRLFRDEWERHGHVRENYPAADGEDLRELRARSDCLMAWGGLLAYLAFGELADARPDGWRFTHPGRAAELHNLPLGEGRLAVVAGDRLTVTLDEQMLLEATPGVVVTAYTRDASRVTGVAGGHGELFLAPPGGGEPVAVPVSDPPRPFEVRARTRSFPREKEPARE